MENANTLRVPFEAHVGASPEISAEPAPSEAVEEADKPARRVRQPLLHRRGNLLLMGLASVCGAVCGAVMIFGGAELPTLAPKTDGSFLSFFLCRFIYGGIFLLAEYILGYFALGEWLVWIVPLCCGMGTALNLAASAQGAAGWWLLPSAAATAALAAFGADASGDMSALLLKIASGRGGSFVTSGSSVKDHTIRFLGYAVLLALSGLYDGAVGIMT